MPDYQNTYANSYLLAIGIDQYADPAFQPLGNSEKEAAEIAEVLAAPPYNFAVQTLIGAEATKTAVQKALNALAKRTVPDDRVIFYFSGHGYTLTDYFGSETGYLACFDTDSTEDFTALKMQEEVTVMRGKTKAKHIAFIFDACFSGQALGLNKSVNINNDDLLTRRAYQVMSAGAPDQTVSDVRSMTRYLLPLLRQPSGLLRLASLHLAVQDQVRAKSGGKQLPLCGHIDGSQGGDFIFNLPDTQGFQSQQSTTPSQNNSQSNRPTAFYHRFQSLPPLTSSTAQHLEPVWRSGSGYHLSQVSYSPDGRFLYIQHSRGLEMRRSDQPFDSGLQIETEFYVEQSPIRFSGSGNRLVYFLNSSGRDLVIRDTESLDEIFRESNQDYDTKAALNYQGDLLALTADDHIQIWDVNNQAEIQRIPCAPNSNLAGLTFTPKGIAYFTRKLGESSTHDPISGRKIAETAPISINLLHGFNLAHASTNIATITPDGLFVGQEYLISPRDPNDDSFSILDPILESDTLKRLMGFDTPNNPYVYNPLRMVIFSPHDAQEFKLINPPSGIPKHIAIITSAISKDGRWLIVSYGTYGKSLVAFDLHNVDEHHKAKVSWRMEQHPLGVAKMLTISPDNQWIVLGGDSYLYRINLNTHQPEQRYLLQSFSPASVGYDENTKRLVATTSSGSFQRRITYEWSILGNPNDVIAKPSHLSVHATVTPNARIIVELTSAPNVSFGGDVAIWDTHQNTEIKRLGFIPAKFAGQRIRTSYDGTIIGYVGDSKISIWDRRKKYRQLKLEGGDIGQTITIKPDNKQLAIATGNTLRILGITEDKACRILSTYFGQHDDVILDMAFGNTGKIFASIDRMGKVVIWSTSQSRSVRQFITDLRISAENGRSYYYRSFGDLHQKQFAPFPDNIKNSDHSSLSQTFERPPMISFSSTDRLLILANIHHGVEVWDWESQTCVARLEKAGTQAMTIEEDKLLVTVNWDGITLWGVASQ